MDAPTLGASGEEAWQNLRTHLEWAEGPWIGFAFARSPAQIVELARRADAVLVARGQRSAVLRPSAPEELRDLLPRVMAEASAGLVWVEAVRADPAPGGPWDQAWSWFLMRANEHREQLRATLAGGLVLAGPTDAKPAFRTVAPDLWSVRAFVLEVEPVARAAGGERGLDFEREVGRAPDVELALAEADRLARTRPEAREARARALIRAVEGLVAEGRTGDALERAREALAFADGTAALPEALAALGDAESEGGDLVAARAHYEQARGRWPEDDTSGRMAVARKLGVTCAAAGDFDAGVSALQEAVAVARGRVVAAPRDTEALSSLSISLRILGDTFRHRGLLSAAEDAYGEALSLLRLLVDEDRAGRHVRDLALTLTLLGGILAPRGDVARAVATLAEAVSILRELRDRQVDAAGPSRDLARALGVLGNVWFRSGDQEAAESAFSESVAIQRQLLARLGEPPDRILAWVLLRAGQLCLRRRDADAAEAAFLEAVSLTRTARDRLGDLPVALRDVSAACGQMAMVHGVKGEFAEGLRYAEETLHIDRLLLQRLGPTPTTLGDLRWSLRIVARLRRDLGDEAGAQAAEAELAALPDPGAP